MSWEKWNRARYLIHVIDVLADREVAVGIRDETDEYLDLNSRTNDALAALPWWQRARFPMMLVNAIRPPVA